jgi:hypothetical protein
LFVCFKLTLSFFPILQPGNKAFEVQDPNQCTLLIVMLNLPMLLNMKKIKCSQEKPEIAMGPEYINY